ncbi:hypothetical protein ACFS07_10210 [Undibacterium arcticum]
MRFLGCCFVAGFCCGLGIRFCLGFGGFGIAALLLGFGLLCGDFTRLAVDLFLCGAGFCLDPLAFLAGRFIGNALQCCGLALLVLLEGQHLRFQDGFGIGQPLRRLAIFVVDALDFLVEWSDLLCALIFDALFAVS